jgi:uncharacterized membrane protein
MVGAALGLVPLAAPFALICGILGVILGFIGKERSRSAGAPYGGAARAGFVLGIVAIAFAILTIILVQIDVY